MTPWETDDRLGGHGADSLPKGFSFAAALLSSSRTTAWLMVPGLPGPASSFTS